MKTEDALHLDVGSVIVYPRNSKILNLNPVTQKRSCPALYFSVHTKIYMLITASHLFKKTRDFFWRKKLISILYITEYLPCSKKYNGGGAERFLHRLASGIFVTHARTHLPTVYLASEITQKKEMPSYPLLIDPDRKNLSEVIKRFNNKNSILHFANTFLLKRHPQEFLYITDLFKGPVIQQVTISSKITDMVKTHNGDLIRDIMSNIDIFISQATLMTSQLKEFGIEPNKIVQIENGIDVIQKKPLAHDVSRLLREKLLPPHIRNHTIFFYAARFTDPAKRLDDLLTAWKEGNFTNKNCVLILTGETPLIDMNGFVKENIIYTGLLSELDIQKYYCIADVYVTPSEMEGFSNSMLEAMAYGIPTIARHGVSGNDDMILENQTGLLYRNLTEMKENMLTLAENASQRKFLGMGARAHVVQNYSFEKIMDKYIALYDRLLSY